VTNISVSDVRVNPIPYDKKIINTLYATPTVRVVFFLVFKNALIFRSQYSLAYAINIWPRLWLARFFLPVRVQSGFLYLMTNLRLHAHAHTHTILCNCNPNLINQAWKKKSENKNTTKKLLPIPRLLEASVSKRTARTCICASVTQYITIQSQPRWISLEGYNIIYRVQIRRFVRVVVCIIYFTKKKKKIIHYTRTKIYYYKCICDLCCVRRYTTVRIIV
jgi:hypothetical protein